MADISKIKLPNGTTYDIKDAGAAANDHTHGPITNDGKLSDGGTNCVANRMVWTGSNSQIMAASHYVDSTHLAIGSNTQPTENLYVNGTARIKGYFNVSASGKATINDELKGTAISPDGYMSVDSGDSTNNSNGYYVRKKSLTQAFVGIGTHETETDSNIARLDLGNNIAIGTTGSARGQLRMYDNGTNFHCIYPKVSGDAITSTVYHVLPKVTGHFVASGSTSSGATGNANTPIYVNSEGYATACSTIISSTQSLSTKNDGYIKITRSGTGRSAYKVVIAGSSLNYMFNLEVETNGINDTSERSYYKLLTSSAGFGDYGYPTSNTSDVLCIRYIGDGSTRTLNVAVVPIIGAQTFTIEYVEGDLPADFRAGSKRDAHVTGAVKFYTYVGQQGLEVYQNGRTSSSTSSGTYSGNAYTKYMLTPPKSDSYMSLFRNAPATIQTYYNGDTAVGSKLNNSYWYFRNMSVTVDDVNAPTTIARGTKYEDYVLPSCDPNMTSAKTYKILTTKDCYSATEKTELQTAIGIPTLLGSYVAKTGDTMTGTLIISTSGKTGGNDGKTGILLNTNGTIMADGNGTETPGYFLRDGAGTDTSMPNQVAFYIDAHGTATAKGISVVSIGNATEEGTIKNSEGLIRIFGNRANYHNIRAARRSATLIDDNNKAVYWEHVLPETNGYLVGGIGGDATHPVYVNSTGIVTACTSIDSSLIPDLYLKLTGGTLTGNLVFNKNDAQVARIFTSQGTTTTAGRALLTLGNATAEGAADNNYGDIILYGKNTKYHRITPYHTSSADRNHILPDGTGFLVSAGSETSGEVGSATKPVYINASGVATACSSSLTDYLPLTGGNMTGAVTNTATDGFSVAKGSLNYAKIGLSATGGTAKLGIGTLTLGNLAEYGTDNNAKGRIVIFASNSKYHIIEAVPGSNNRNHYLTNGDGYLVTGGSVTFNADGSVNTKTGVGDVNRPVYINNNGIATTCVGVYSGTALPTTGTYVDGDVFLVY